MLPEVIVSAECSTCKAKLYTEAEVFLHDRMHAAQWGTPHGLNRLPFSLVPAVAKAMEQYADYLMESRID